MEQPNNQSLPEFSPEEMKMPQEEFQAAPAQRSWLIPVLIVVVILLALAAAGLYIWSTLAVPVEPAVLVEPPLATEPIEENPAAAATTTDSDIEELQTVNTSDEISAIENDIEDTEMEEMDAELNEIDAELNSTTTTAN